ncbi:NAD-dependent dihydropyrimidine dehydrogenase PreA subunit [Bacilli bacterium PM5-3]|nr:NAD-dependent dihydropyrimidine dehydrogenase PreA subunit [Bacilli bacterium PM5-3]MDH6604100.1 NAD-dependent dihydropyrimidine dehydrogenase PreA subunit [Bacilli bacterium PM5-9]
MPAVVKEEECIGCAACVGSCPVSVIEMTDEGKAHVGEGCIDCAACVGTCPVSCIEMV